MPEKVTIMILEVDLQCPCCYKKVKKLLCDFPQIRDQVYDEKKNTVTITVVCCSPEKIRDKLCCKGGKVIKSIVIKPPSKDPEKDKEPEKKPVPTPVPVLVPVLVPVAPQPQPAPAPPPQPVPMILAVPCCGPCSEGRDGGPCYQGYGSTPSIFPNPFDTCCGPCSEGRSGGPCYQGYGGSRRCYVSICDYYISEDNPSACTIM